MTLDQISARIIRDLIAHPRFMYADHRLVADVVCTTVTSLKANFGPFELAVMDKLAADHLAETSARVDALITPLDKQDDKRSVALFT